MGSGGGGSRATERGRDLRIQGLQKHPQQQASSPSLSLSVLISKMGVRRLGLASGNSPFTYSQVASGQAGKQQGEQLHVPPTVVAQVPRRKGVLNQGQEGAVGVLCQESLEGAK